jgi:hypothetical protein
VKTIKNQVRQGDVLVTPIDAIPQDAAERKPEKRGTVLAHGELTGHAHCVDTRKVSDVEFPDEVYGYVKRALKVLGDTPLRHTNPDGSPTHEHDDIALRPGNRLVIIQREALSDDESRRVED